MQKINTDYFIVMIDRIHDKDKISYMNIGLTNLNNNKREVPRFAE